MIGYVLYGFEEIAQWHAESNSSISVILMITMTMMMTMMMMMMVTINLLLYIWNYPDDIGNDTGEHEAVEVKWFNLLCVCAIQVLEDGQEL